MIQGGGRSRFLPEPAYSLLIGNEPRRQHLQGQLSAEPHIFVYDNYPGGIGFSRPLYEMHLPLLQRSRELIDGCPCASGCPSCVGPEGNTGPHAKQVASMILQQLLEGAPA